MKPPTPIITLAVLLTAYCTLAQTNQPFLIGDGKEKISAETIEHIATVARSVGGDAVRLWLLHCDAYKSGPNVGHVFRVHAYSTPRVSSGRLLRGEGIVCLDSTLDQYWDKKSSRFGGWYSADIKPREYGLVAPVGRAFGTNEPSEKPFELIGTLSDADVIAIVDAIRLSATNQRIQSLQFVDATHISVRTEEGGGWRGLRVEFQKVGDVWIEIRRRKWVV